MDAGRRPRRRNGWWKSTDLSEGRRSAAAVALAATIAVPDVRRRDHDGKCEQPESTQL